VWASLVEQGIRGEAEGVVEVFGGETGVVNGGDDGDGDIAGERSPVFLFCVVYDPSFARGWMRVGTGKREGVKKPCVVRAKG
jgi:hypothetical protein